jgi:hypothetical protein
MLQRLPQRAAPLADTPHLATDDGAASLSSAPSDDNILRGG